MDRPPLRRLAVLAVVAGFGAGTISVAHAATAADTQDCAGYVGLTFDDGPTAGTTRTLLNALATAGVRATMFNTGENVQADPDLARDQVTAGMWIGNHSWDHPYLTQLSAAEQASQISRTQDVVRQVTGVTPQLFRPPYLDTNDALRAVERQYGLTEINADVDSQDWNNASVDQIVATVGQARAGDVVLMHDWPPNTVQAIPRIVAGLQDRGLCAGMISPSTGRAVAPSIPGPSSGTCTATFRTVGSWNGGFQGDVAVTNGGTSAFNGWKTTLVLPAGVVIRSLWNGVASGTTGTVTVTNAGHNGALGAGQSTSFGFVATGSGAGTTATCADSSTTTPPPTGEPSNPPIVVLDRAHTAGRVDDRVSNVRYTWPGVYFEGRFHGTGVGIVLDDTTNDYEIQIDATTPVSLVTPGKTTHWIDDLTDADHTVRIAKRTESPWAAGQFGGFVAAPGGTILAKPAARTRQIEFIGDSWTAGYGAMSTSRDCAGSGGIDRNNFSTALNPGEPWATEAALTADYRAAYLGFLDKLRTRYGTDTYLVLTYPDLSNTTALADSINQIVEQRTTEGDTRVRALHYDNTALGLDLLGCDWHPSLHDHKAIAGSLTSYVNSLPVTW